MELEMESRPVPLPHRSRDWRDRSQSAARPSTSSGSLSSAGPPVFSSSSAFSQRRRSSAAHARPAGPPPNLPIPNVPGRSSTHSRQGSDANPDPPEVPVHPQPYINGIGRGSSLSGFMRSGGSPNLAAVAAFSQSRNTSLSSQPPQFSASSSVEDLSDPPPQSNLPSFSPSRSPDQNQGPPHDQPLLSPPEPRAPSSRRALTRALELAREAVQLDSTNDNPYAAVMAYGRSVALLSEVMERVRRGEDSTEHRRRNGRRRSVVAQEEEVRRLQNIHDTYADRMNILSIIYSIPPIPYSTSLVYSSISTDTTQSTSPTTSTSPSSDTSDQIPRTPPTLNQGQHDPGDYADDRPGHDRHHSTGAASSAIFVQENSRHDGTVISGLPHTSYHPYAAATQYDSLPQTVVSPPINPPPTSVVTRRNRSTSSALPPPPPPPSNALPPAPASFVSEPTPDPSSSQVPRPYLDVGRPRTDSGGHKRTNSGSRLAALEEETEKYDGGFQDSRKRVAEPRKDVRNPVLDSSRNPKRDAQPLPPLPSPTLISTNPSATPRNPLPPPKQPPSPRIPSTIIPRPRGSSQLSAYSESLKHPLVINSSTNQGTIFQRRSKTSASPSSRSSSPAGSTASAGSVPIHKGSASSLPGSTASAIGVGRSRSVSQPGRRPSVINDRVSAMDQRPPMPVVGMDGSNPPRNSPIPSRFKAQPQPLKVQTDMLMPSSGAVGANSLIPQPPLLSSNLPTTPTSPLPPVPPTDPLRKPYHMMNLLRGTMTSATGGYVTRRLHVPQEVWSQGGAKLANVLEKVRVVGILCSALEDLQGSSSDYFGAGNVSSGLALGIGSIGRKEGEAWVAKLEEFSSVCDGVVANFGKKLGVGEGFVLKKTTWGDKLTRRFDKFTNGKNLDSPAAYVQGLRKLFLHAQLLDEHTKAVISQPVAPAYAAFPMDIRATAEIKLKRSSEFFASVVLTFVIRDLSQLLDKYAKKCEKWLAE